MSFQPETGYVPAANLHYISAGQGDPVVLIHGWGGFKEIWWRTLQALSPTFRAIAFDWPTAPFTKFDPVSGDSQTEMSVPSNSTPALPAGREGAIFPPSARDKRSHQPDSLDASARRYRQNEPPESAKESVLDTFAYLLVTACDSLALGPITLIGHSLGGNVAARVALSHPELVTRLALIDAAVDAIYLAPGGKFYVSSRLGPHAFRLNNLLMWPLSALGGLVSHEHAGGFLMPLARRQYYLQQQNPRTLLSHLKDLYEGSLGERVSEIVQPTLVVAGGRDPLVNPLQAYRLAETIPHAHLRLIRSAYHCPMDETPSAFNAALLGFLERHPVSAAR